MEQCKARTKAVFPCEGLRRSRVITSHTQFQQKLELKNPANKPLRVWWPQTGAASSSSLLLYLPCYFLQWEWDRKVTAWVGMCFSPIEIRGSCKEHLKTMSYFLELHVALLCTDSKSMQIFWIENVVAVSLDNPWSGQSMILSRN